MAKWIFFRKNKMLNMDTCGEQYKVLGYPHRNELGLRCSECKKVTFVDESIAYNYCPHCGEKIENPTNFM